MFSPLLWLACQQEPPREPSVLVSGDGHVLREALRGVASLQGTPAASWADAQLEGLPGCDELTGSDPLSLQRTLGSLRCDEGAGDPHALYWSQLHPSGWEGEGSLRLELDTLYFEGDVEPPLSGWAWLPDAQPPPDSLILEAEAAWLQAWGRIADLPALVRTLPQLGGSLDGAWSPWASATLLDGSWSLLGLPPAAGSEFPGLVVALGVRSETLARASLDELLQELRNRWGIAPKAQGDYQCFSDLRLLPGLQPCYLLESERFLLSWGQQDLQRTTAAEASDRAAMQIRMDFSRLEESDLLLRGEEEPQIPLEWPWREGELRLLPEGPSYHFQLRLVSR